MHRSFILRMAAKILALWLLLAGTVFPQGCCQHWSYGLSPGGKRDLDNFSDTLGNMVEEFPRVEAPCSVFGCAEESPFAKMYRVKGLLASVAERENGHRTFKK
ncbi:progonadoliberin-1 [Maylandia zebra]|nr:progonadoliberin-1 [Maylandia zebra]XP_006803239.1 progonadoliberin-1 [Neolamprologus brichardi]XP_014190526.1 progonadoliberin-1 isoform X1 [Haplochromis burtoni]XP_026043636.1 progonadoliberin-1 [Astatotilapia calliptera]